MDSDDLILEIREKARSLRATQLACHLDHISGGKLSQFFLISVFTRALPQIPLPVLVRAGRWNRLSGGRMTDEELDRLFEQWLPIPETTPPITDATSPDPVPPDFWSW